MSKNQASCLTADEIISPNQIQVGTKLFFPVPESQQERRIYLFLDTKSTGDFILLGTVKTYKNGTVTGLYPAGLFVSTTAQTMPNKSVAMMFSAGGSAVGDSLILALANPFNASLTSVILQPLRINDDITHVSFEIDAFAGLITGYRAYLGVANTQY